MLFSVFKTIVSLFENAWVRAGFDLLTHCVYVHALSETRRYGIRSAGRHKCNVRELSSYAPLCMTCGRVVSPNLSELGYTSVSHPIYLFRQSFMRVTYIETNTHTYNTFTDIHIQWASPTKNTSSYLNAWSNVSFACVRVCHRVAFCRQIWVTNKENVTITSILSPNR